MSNLKYDKKVNNLGSQAISFLPVSIREVSIFKYCIPQKGATKGAYSFLFLGRHIFCLSGYLCFQVTVYILCVYYDK